jgi:hypothetical protein
LDGLLVFAPGVGPVLAFADRLMQRGGAWVGLRGILEDRVNGSLTHRNIV